MYGYWGNRGFGGYGGFGGCYPFSGIGCGFQRPYLAAGIGFPYYGGIGSFYGGYGGYGYY